MFNSLKASRDPISQEVETIGKAILDSAFDVHSALGPGLLESIYEACLAYELKSRNIDVETQIQVPIAYKELRFNFGLRLDMLVEKSVIVEIKAVESLLPVHEAQLLSYLKLTGTRLGFLLNFNTVRLKEGIKRLVL